MVKQYESTGLDLTPREFVVMAPLLVLIFWMGIFPNQFLHWSKASVEHLIKNKHAYELVIHKQSHQQKVAETQSEQ